MFKRIMKAPNIVVPFDSKYIKYPMMGSVKIDGFRVSVQDGQLLSSSLKPFRNRNLVPYLKELLTLCDIEKLNFDGELFLPKKFNELQSVFSSFEEPIPPDTKYYIFDMLTRYEWDSETEPTFDIRYRRYTKILNKYQLANVVPLPQVLLSSPKEAEEFYEKSLRDGHEGIILRSLGSYYKHGRATANQGAIFKFKEYVTIDCLLVGFEPRRQMKDEYKRSERGRDEAGRLIRSFKMNDYIYLDEIGSYIVELPNGNISGVGVAKDVNLGITWNNKEQFLKKHCEVRYMPMGTKDAVRIGYITRLRPDLD